MSAVTVTCPSCSLAFGFAIFLLHAISPPVLIRSNDFSLAMIADEERMIGSISSAHSSSMSQQFESAGKIASCKRKPSPDQMSTRSALDAKEIISSVHKSISRTHQTLVRTRLIHATYILVLGIYTALGAVIFQLLDGEHDELKWQEYNERCQDVRESLEIRLASGRNSPEVVRSSLRSLAACYEDWHNAHTPPTLSNADFTNSLLYAFSVYTTIGYGNVACETTGCRYATIGYAVIGIPLFFAFVSDVSLLLSTWFLRVRLLRFNCLSWCCKRGSKVDDDLKMVPNGNRQEKITSTKLYQQDVQSNSTESVRDVDSPISANDSPQSVHRESKSGDTSEKPRSSSTISWFFTDEQQEKQGSGTRRQLHTARSGNRDHGLKTDDQRQVFALACLVFMLYMLCVSAIMCLMDKWDLFTSFYFLFSSVALVGFGDVFPKESRVVMINCAFIVMGVVLFGMCYFVLQEEIRERAYRASRHARRSLKKYKENMARTRRKWTSGNLLTSPKQPRRKRRSVSVRLMDEIALRGRKMRSSKRRRSAPGLVELAVSATQKSPPVTIVTDDETKDSTVPDDLSSSGK